MIPFLSCKKAQANIRAVTPIYLSIRSKVASRKYKRTPSQRSPTENPYSVGDLLKIYESQTKGSKIK